MKRVVMPMCEISDLLKAYSIIKNIQIHYPQKIKLIPLYVGIKLDVREKIAEMLGDKSWLEMESESINLYDSDSKIDSYHDGAKWMGSYFDDEKPDLYLSQGSSLPSFLMAREAFTRKISILNFSPESDLFEYAHMTFSKKKLYEKMLSAMATFSCVANTVQAEKLKKNGFKHNEIGVTGDPTVDAMYSIITTSNDQIKTLEDFKSHTKNIFVYLGMHQDRVADFKQMNLYNFIAKLSKSNLPMNITVGLSPELRNSISVRYALSIFPNISVIDELDYLRLIELIMKSNIVISDTQQISCEVEAMSKQYIYIDHDQCDATKLTLTNRSRLSNITDDIWQMSSIGATWIAPDINRLINQFNSQQNSNSASIYGDGKAGFRIAKLIDNWARNEVFTPHAYDPWH